MDKPPLTKEEINKKLEENRAEQAKLKAPIDYPKAVEPVPTTPAAPEVFKVDRKVFDKINEFVINIQTYTINKPEERLQRLIDFRDELEKATAQEEIESIVNKYTEKDSYYGVQIKELLGFPLSNFEKNSLSFITERNVKNNEESKEKTEEKKIDELYADALRVVAEEGKASISTLQRRLRIGYGRVADILERMQQDGIIASGEMAGPMGLIMEIAKIRELSDKLANEGFQTQRSEQEKDREEDENLMREEHIREIEEMQDPFVDKKVFSLINELWYHERGKNPNVAMDLSMLFEKLKTVQSREEVLNAIEAADINSYNRNAITDLFEKAQVLENLEHTIETAQQRLLEIEAELATLPEDEPAEEEQSPQIASANKEIAIFDEIEQLNKELTTQKKKWFSFGKADELERKISDLKEKIRLEREKALGLDKIKLPEDVREFVFKEYNDQKDDLIKKIQNNETSWIPTCQKTIKTLESDIAQHFRWLKRYEGETLEFVLSSPKYTIEEKEQDKTTRQPRIQKLERVIQALEEAKAKK